MREGDAGLSQASDAPYTLTLRPGHEDLLQLDWAQPLAR
jgi:hypothetical protein